MRKYGLYTIQGKLFFQVKMCQCVVNVHDIFRILSSSGTLAHEWRAASELCSVSLKHICAHMDKSIDRKLQEQGGISFHAITHTGQHWDTLATLSPTLHLATFWCVHQLSVQATTYKSYTDTDYPSYYTTVWRSKHICHGLKVYTSNGTQTVQ